MEHLQAAVYASNESLAAPQNVIDAIVTLTRAGLMSWDESTARTRPSFTLDVESNLLDHNNDATDDDAGGFAMTVTPEQSKAIVDAVTAAELEFRAVQADVAAAAGK